MNYHLFQHVLGLSFEDAADNSTAYASNTIYTLMTVAIINQIADITIPQALTQAISTASVAQALNAET